MDLHILLVAHTLPLWFLVLSLFLPRIALVLMWLDGKTVPINMHEIVPVIVAAVLPRVLVLYLIYADLGIGLWFVIHVIAALMVWGGSHAKITFGRRRER